MNYKVGTREWHNEAVLEEKDARIKQLEAEIVYLAGRVTKAEAENAELKDVVAELTAELMKHLQKAFNNGRDVERRIIESESVY